ncbi:MAG: enoyl-CoA hydratase [Pollutimonas bauzanensis]|uniref:Enoyl-CoA hydratase/carnithine racemase n=1 Tax=Pollutimonas bauzanensis TaxID=658167 RepID=A0A1M5X5Q2_9BURK|nr:enoyl-CoA hydratase [Pollutimonas bauzanensis]SHH95170.1 Enoyl-CoA hydratase/carnithine racemase [Pollutimonas bauzanensis]
MAELIIERSASIGRLLISNPDKYNAMTLDMWENFPAMLAALEQDSSVRAICIEGDGAKAFLSGSDISQFKAERSDSSAQARYNAAVDQAMLAPIRCSKPVLAKIRGICMGGGVGIAAACDIRICADNARFRIPVARLGIGYGVTPLQRLISLIGEQNACDVLFSARIFDGAEARALGFVAHCVELSRLDEFCEEWLSQVSENAPLSLKSIKRSMAELRKEKQDRDHAAMENGIAACFSSKDYKEGVAAFAEKRKPIFTGS